MLILKIKLSNFEKLTLRKHKLNFSSFFTIKRTPISVYIGVHA